MIAIMCDYGGCDTIIRKGQGQYYFEIQEDDGQLWGVCPDCMKAMVFDSSPARIESIRKVQWKE